MKLRIISKILYKDAPLLYILQEKRWWGWTNVLWGRYCKFYYKFGIYDGKSYEVVRSKNLDEMIKWGDDMYKGYLNKEREKYDKKYNFKPIIEVVKEYN